MPVLSDRYQLGEMVYSDASVVAYRGRDQLLNRDVTVEVLRESCAADPQYCKRLIDKGRAAALTNLPNVAAIYDQQTIDQRPFLVSEELAGPALAERAPLPPDQTGALIIAVATTLRAALDRNHPLPMIGGQTVRLGVEGRVQIVDFGLDQAAPDETTAVQQLGHLLLLALGDQRASALHDMGQRAAAAQIPSIAALLHEMTAAQHHADTPTMVVPRAPTTIPIEPRAATQATQVLVNPPDDQPDQRARSARKPWLWPALATSGIVLALVIGGVFARGRSATAEGDLPTPAASAGQIVASSAPNAASAGASNGGGARYVVAARGSATVRVRSGPGTSFNQIASLPNGTVVEVIEGPQPADNYNWVHIRADGVDGWCILEALRPQP